MLSKKKTRVSLQIAAIVFLFLWLAPYPSSCSVGSIDIFTQKEFFNGKGLHEPSDAFAPGQKVIVYALVSYYHQPVKDVLVKFTVKGPSNDDPEVMLQISSETNESGIAQIEFRIPGEDNDATFGIWKIFGSVELEGQLIQDSLEFKVGWIVEILDVKTLNENFSYVSTFGIGGYVGVEIVLKNIAMTIKNATLCLNVFDALKTPVNITRIENLGVPPNERTVYLYSKVYLPQNMLIGNASLQVSAFTPLEEGGQPYCPNVAINFSVGPFRRTYPNFHDVSTFIVLPSHSLEIGQKLAVELYVQNEGTETENFEVQLSLNSIFSETYIFQSLSPYSQRKVIAEWDTSGLEEKSYSIISYIAPLENEVDLTDNTYMVNITLFKEEEPPPQPQPTHDIAVKNVVPSDTQVYESEVVEVYVNVINNGTEVECFNVTLYYDSNVVDVLYVKDLAAGESLNLTFVWNTLGVAEGNYTLRAEASVVEGEVNVDNNVFVDGVVEVRIAPVGFVHDVAVVHVEASPRTVEKGGVVNLKVRVRNEGNFSESFNVTVFYDGFAVETRYISRLEAGQETTLSVFWNTSNVNVGVYTIRAEASRVVNEEDLEDNTLTDGTVEVVEAEKYRPPWPLWLLLFVIGLLAALGLVALAIILYRRRQLKRFRRAFYSGWHAWFYNYDLTRKK